MFNSLRFHVFFVISICITISAPALGRLSKEEKSALRASYWGLFADIYRARTCFDVNLKPDKCAMRALDDAVKHVSKVDMAVGFNSNEFAREVDLILQLIRSSHLDNAKARLLILQDKLIFDFANNTAPVLPPSHSIGKSLFDEYCGGCHGDGIKNAGRLTPQLRFKPEFFATGARRSSQSPFGIYSVMIHGVDNSEMASMLDVLSVDELWSISFYLASLPYINTPQIDTREFVEFVKSQSEEFALSTLAISTDEDLVKRITRLGFICGDCDQELAYMRTQWPWSTETGRLGITSKNPRQKMESRALWLLLGSFVAVSGGFYIVLRRRNRVE